MLGSAVAPVEPGRETRASSQEARTPAPITRTVRPTGKVNVPTQRPPAPAPALSGATAARRSLEYELDIPMRRVLIETETLMARVQELGREISEAYRGRLPLLVSVLKGGVVF